MSSSSDAIAYHESLAAGWSDRYAAGGFKRRAAFFASDVLPRLRPSGDWLDVGCGSGVFSRMLAEVGASVLGLDGSPAMVEAARSASAGVDARYEVRKVEEVGALEGVFHGAICLSVIEYLPDPEAALRAIAAKLKPGGRAAFSVPNRGSTLRLAQRALRPLARSKALDYMDSSRHLWRRGELAALAQAADFEVEAILGFDPVAPRPLWPLLSPSLWFVVARKQG
jgi:2-polyprenyl-6-hydroxyphenyl methylase/3-demethylubiquinone-9 3-methyltransferase